MAAMLLGLREVPTIALEHLSEPQAKAFMIADNRLTDNSAWDERLLAEQLKELSVLDLDFSLEITGFTMGEIDLRIENLSPAPDGKVDPADVLPEASPGVAVTRRGDLWLLDEHRVHCRSALESAAFATLMQGETAAMGFTDPPYNVPIEGHVSGLGAIHHREFAMAVGEMSPAQFTTFLTRALSAHADHSTEGSIHFVFTDWRHLTEVLAAGAKAYTELKNLCIWAKDSPGMGSLYRSQHELIFVFKKGRAAHRNNVQLGQYGRNRSNLWCYPAANSFARNTSDEGNLLGYHPTPKPVALVADAILDCSGRNEIVLDGFLGSGSTLIAAQRTGRRCFGLELDPLYVDTVVRRWEAFTGGRAVRAGSDVFFDDLENRREESRHGGN